MLKIEIPFDPGIPLLGIYPNNAAMNIGVHISFQIIDFVLLSKISRSGITGSNGFLFLVF